MYESPIEVLYGQMQTEIENDLLVKCSQAVEYNINKDELIKALKYDREQYERGYSDGLNADKWISVKDRLPEIGKSVLIYYPYWGGDEIQVAKLEYDEMMFDVCGEFDIRVEAVTHWIPLPEPPKE